MSTLTQFLPGRTQFNPYVFTATNAAFTINYTGKYRISLMGSGGSGGAIFYTTVGGAATGGGGGGFTELECYLTAADSLNITIGAGGTAAASSVSQTGTAGNAGGNTTVTGSGSAVAAALNLAAAAGNGGTWTILPSMILTPFTSSCPITISTNALRALPLLVL